MDLIGNGWEGEFNNIVYFQQVHLQKNGLSLQK